MRTRRSVLELLLGSLDDSAGNARGSCGTSPFGYRMNDDRGASIAEDGVIVVAESYVGRDNGNVRSAVGSDDQGKIRDVAGGRPVVMVRATAGIEVGTCGSEARRVAFCDLMDVNGVFAGREILDVQSDFHAFRSAGKSGASHDLAFRILEFDGGGSCPGLAMGSLSSHCSRQRDNQTQRA